VTAAEHRNHARNYLTKATEYLASADDNLAMERPTPAAGDAVHAGISAKDAIVTALTGSTNKAKDHAAASKDLRQALGQRDTAAAAERALRELLSVKAEIEYGTVLITLTKAEPLVRRAHTLVDLATSIVRLGR
jgi:hypothetical protein